MLVALSAALITVAGVYAADQAPPFFELYASVDEATARYSAACQRSEDEHVCNVDRSDNQGHGSGNFCCATPRPSPDKFMNNCGGTRPTGLPFAGRSPAYAQHGMAATSVMLSTICALDMLKAGGTAVDAAIAANACEGVVEPMMNGMGGDLMAQVWHGPTRKLHGYNGSGRSPHNLTYAGMKELLREQDLKRIPGEGPLGVSVPGAVMGWWDLHQRFGRLPWGELFKPAIQYARDGHPVAQVIAAEWYVPANTSTLTSGGKFPHALDGFVETFTVKDAQTGKRRTPRAGEIFRNPALADTLEVVAVGGAEAFYNGSIARKFDAYRAVSGLQISSEDLRRHRGAWVTPVSTSYREQHRIYELPPNPQGIAALQMLNLLERFDLRAMGFNSADYLHVHVEAKKLAFADRAKFYADPDFGGPTEALVEGLISKRYAAERAPLINMSHAAKVVPPGTPPSEAARRFGFPETAAAQSLDHTSADTMYLTVADSEGTMVSLIQSNYMGFGSGLVIPELGFGLQDRGSLFNMAEGSANQYMPGKRPFHTIIPGFATRIDEDGTETPWLSFGVMGGNIQPQGHAQILCNLVDFGMNVQEAGDAARYTHSGSSQPTGQVMDDGGVVQIEGGVCPDVASELGRRGHRVYRGPNGGGYQAIMRDPATGSYIGATEMRKDGIAAGY